MSYLIWHDDVTMPTYRTVLHITVAEQLIISSSQLLPKVKKFLRENLFILNSEYIIKERLGKPVYNVPKFFDLIEDSPPNVRLPRGFLGQLMEFLDKEKIPYQVTHHHPDFVPRGFHSTITLTPEQERLTKLAFDAGQGVIAAPPGSGKTMMGLSLVARHTSARLHPLQAIV